jgi:hypothetical protein
MKNSWIENPNNGNMLLCLFYTFKFLFLVVFQSFVFGQILTDFGSFGQFWVEFTALTMAESMLQSKTEIFRTCNS